MTADALSVVSALELALGKRGFDLVRPFSVKQINDRAPPGSGLPLLGREDALGVLVGNSRALWAPFTGSLPSEAELGPAPLDDYTESSCRAVLRELGPIAELDALEEPTWLGFSHQVEPAPLPMQRLADASGLARFGPAHLNVHPRFGPWIALRAVFVFALPPPADAGPGAPSPCLGCAAPCRDALCRALSPRADDVRPSAPAALSDSQARFLRVREVCPVGRSERYSDAQIAYHYAKDRKALGAER